MLWIGSRLKSFTLELFKKIKIPRIKTLVLHSRICKGLKVGSKRNRKGCWAWARKIRV